MTTCGEVLVKLLEAYGIDTDLRHPRRAHGRALSRPADNEHPPRHAAPRAGRGLHGRRLCPRLRHARRLLHHLRPRHDQHRHRHGPGLFRFDPDAGDLQRQLSDELGMGEGRLHELPDQQRPGPGVSVFSHRLLRAAAPARGHGPRLRGLRQRPRPGPVHIELPLDVITAQADDPRPRRLDRYPSRPGPDPDAIARAAALLRGAKRPLSLLGGGTAGRGGRRPRAGRAPRRAGVTDHQRQGRAAAGPSAQPRQQPAAAAGASRRCRRRTWCWRSAPSSARPSCSPAASGRARRQADPHRHRPLQQVTAAPRPRSPICRTPAGDAGAARRASPTPAARPRRRRGRRVRAARSTRLCGRPARRTGASSTSSPRRCPARSSPATRPSRSTAATTSTRPPGRAPGSIPRTGYGTLGYGLPAAFGAKLGRPDAAVVALIGDGGIQFTIRRLATAVGSRASPVPILLWNNQGYGEIKTYMADRDIPQIGVDIYTPDFAEHRPGLRLRGARGRRASRTCGDALREAVDAQDGPDGDRDRRRARRGRGHEH